VLHDELKEILRELAACTGAVSVAIVYERTIDVEGPLPPQADFEPEEPSRNADDLELIVPVGGGALLRAHFACPEAERSADGRDAALERAARALRACARRWDAATLPPLALPDAPASSRERILCRISDYLRAFSNSPSMVNAALVRRCEVVASAEPLSELQRERIPFTVKRVNAEAARRRATSHAEVAGEDFFAVSFYFDAYLIAFFEGPYALDFVRHRARLVTRELSHLLALLDEPPVDPAQAAPAPE
jgi:hypothetical protein